MEHTGTTKKGACGDDKERSKRGRELNRDGGQTKEHVGTTNSGAHGNNKRRRVLGRQTEELAGTTHEGDGGSTLRTLLVSSKPSMLTSPTPTEREAARAFARIAPTVLRIAATAAARKEPSSGMTMNLSLWAPCKLPVHPQSTSNTLVLLLRLSRTALLGLLGHQW